MKKVSLPRQDKEIWQAPTWYQALFLAERLAHSQKLRPRKKGSPRLLQAWKAQSPFNHGPFFAQRLASDALTEERFLAILAESAGDLKARIASTPAWLSTLVEAFSERNALAEAQPLLQEVLENHPMGAYMQTISPLLLYGCVSLSRQIQALQQRYAVLPFDRHSICQAFLNTHIPELFSQMSKVIVLEMHVARLQGRLSGDTPEERFADFIRQLDQEAMILPLLAEYPVLARTLVSTIEDWVNYTHEILEHLCADWPAICTLFAEGNDPGFLVDVQGGAGDRHRRGRSVHILQFLSGLQLVYKPKPLAVDQHFQELLTWLNEQGAQPPFRTLKVLNRGDYGWSEFVEGAPCTSQDEVARFYERQGGYLALLYTLNATDVHVENVIASGEHPMLIDLETLFHPNIDNNSLPQADDLVSQAIEQSILRIGLLPQRIWSNEHSPGIDISGLGGLPGQQMPHAVPEWQAIRTDQMHLVRQYSEVPAGQNRVQLNDNDVNVLDYSNSIVTGFTRMYRLLIQQRDALLTEQLPRFAHAEVRVIVRPTQIYGTFLDEGSHPDLLREALERDCFFDRLWQEIEQRPFLARLIPVERQDLLGGDIPLFTTFPESRTIFTSERAPLDNMLEASGLDLVQRKIRQLDERDLARQAWIIQASLATLQMESTDQIESTLPPQPVPQPVKREQLIMMAKAIGERLEDLAFQNGTEVCWLGVHPLHENAWGLLPIGRDMYSGLSGIALFLAYLGATTGEVRFTSLAKLALASIQTQIQQQKNDLPETNVGAFDGWGSLLYLFTHLGVLWNMPELLHKAEKLGDMLPELISGDTSLDIVSGSAGCLLCLLSLYAIQPSPGTLERAIQCGDHLLATARTMPEGTGWATGNQVQPLGGFSHGGSGIAFSLLQLAKVSGEQRFYQTALAALAYERSLFIPAQQNWADLRQKDAPDPQQHCMVAWCHGAAGIGLGRLGAL
ncbi:MAG TPA: type 2 lanthipeptide synthetase LanM family protein, partial [Ktedonobacteraceae bacterium]|nr:type 2 lanthipeptide synthetase LanM family protein [Ktedonobacteraceae bacterium]